MPVGWLSATSTFPSGCGRQKPASTASGSSRTRSPFSFRSSSPSSVVASRQVRLVWMRYGLPMWENVSSWKKSNGSIVG